MRWTRRTLVVIVAGGSLAIWGLLYVVGQWAHGQVQGELMRRDHDLAIQLSRGVKQYITGHIQLLQRLADAYQAGKVPADADHEKLCLPYLKSTGAGGDFLGIALLDSQLSLARMSPTNWRDAASASVKEVLGSTPRPLALHDIQAHRVSVAKTSIGGVTGGNDLLLFVPVTVKEQVTAALVGFLDVPAAVNEAVGAILAPRGYFWLTDENGAPLYGKVPSEVRPREVRVVRVDLGTGHDWIASYYNGIHYEKATLLYDTILLVIGVLAACALVYLAYLGNRHAFELRGWLERYRALSESLQTAEDEVQAANERLQQANQQLVERHAELMRIYEEVEAARTQYQNLVQGSVEAIFVVDPGTHRILEVSRQAEVLTGYSRDDLLTMGVLHLQPAGEAARALLPWDVGPEEPPLPREFSLLRTDGTVVPAEATSKHAEFGGQPAVLVSVRDITQRRQLEAERLRAERLQGVLAATATAAHEINNPLAIIKANAQFLKEQLPPAMSVQQVLDEISAACDRILDAVGKMSHLRDAVLKPYAGGPDLMVDLDASSQEGSTV